jgi:hypothetical protein
MQQTHADVSVTAPRTSGGIRCRTSLNQVPGGSTSTKVLSDTFRQTTD